MIHLGVNWLAVVVAAVVGMAIGFAWYSESLFGKQWCKLMGMSKKDIAKCKKEGMGKKMLLGFLSTAFTAYVLSMVMSWYGSWDLVSSLDVALWVWLGFTGMTILGGSLWEKKPMKLVWINAGHSLLVVLAMATVLFYMA